MRCFTKLSVFLLVLLSCVNFAFADPLAPSQTPVEPTSPPIKGGYWMAGTSPGFGNCVVYVPVADDWCLFSDNTLTRYGGSSVRGLMVDGKGLYYDFRCSVYGVPSVTSHSTHKSYDFPFTVTSSNLIVSSEFEPTVPARDITPYFIMFLTGAILVVIISKKG